jgi:hypothetical protein
MANLKREGFRETLPTLKAIDLKGSRLTVVTIATAPEIVPGQKGRGNREKLLLMRFAEWPDRVYYPNSTSIGRLMKGLGDETELMRGKRIPLQVILVPNPETREEVDALHIAPTEEWETLIEEFDGESDGETSARRRTRKKTTRK